MSCSGDIVWPVRALITIALVALLGCGDDAGGSTTDAGSNTDPGSTDCSSCMGALTQTTNACSTTLDSCTNNPMNDTATHVACFQTDARCYHDALDVSAGCKRPCDASQANVETCTSDCYLVRGNCAEAAVRANDLCLDNCSGASCILCRTQGQQDFARCDSALSTCAEVCKQRHR